MYGEKRLGSQISAYIESLPGEILYVGVLFAVVGLVSAIRREGRSGFAFISFASYLFYLLIFHMLSNLPLDEPLYLDIHSRFWQQANLIVCIWAGYGFANLYTVPASSRSKPSAIRKRRSKHRKKKAAPSLRSRNLTTYGVPVLAVCLVAGQLLIHWQREDQHKNWIVHRWGEAILTTLPQNALVFTKGDLWVNTIRYLQQVEGIRRDVCLLDLELLKTTWMKSRVEVNYPDIVIPGSAYREENQNFDVSQHYTLQDLVEANINSRPVFVNRFQKLSEFEWPEPYVSQQAGFLIRVFPESAPFDINTYIETSEVAFQGYQSASAGVRIRPGSWESVIRDSYITSRDAYASVIVTYANAHGNESSLLRRAADVLEELIVLQPKPLFYKNLGIVYLRLGRTDSTVIPKMVEAWQTYLSLASDDDPDIPNIQRELDRATGRNR